MGPEEASHLCKIVVFIEILFLVLVEKKKFDLVQKGGPHARDALIIYSTCSFLQRFRSLSLSLSQDSLPYFQKVCKSFHFQIVCDFFASLCYVLRLALVTTWFPGLRTSNSLLLIPVLLTWLQAPKENYHFYSLSPWFVSSNSYCFAVVCCSKVHMSYTLCWFFKLSLYGGGGGVVL